MASWSASGHRGVAEAVLDVVHLRLHVEQRLEGAAGLLEDGAAAVREAVLGQVADGQPGGLDHGAGVGLLEAGEHLEQRGLAGAVRAAQADAVAVANLPGDVFEEGPDPKGLGDVCELNQGLDPILYRPRQRNHQRANELLASAGRGGTAL